MFAKGADTFPDAELLFSLELLLVVRCGCLKSDC